MVHCAFCIVASAATTYTWQDTDGTGILNTPENWSPALGPVVSGDVYSIPLPDDGSGGAFRLDDDLVASTFKVSGGAADGAPAVFDLGGHFLCVTNFASNGFLNIATPNPVVFRNGSLRTWYYLFLGIDKSDAPVRLAFTNVVARPHQYYRRYAPTVYASFSGCDLIGFPRGGSGSNTHLDFHDTSYSLANAGQHFGATRGATNVTMRFSGNCSFDRYNTQWYFGGNGAATNCHYVFESGAVFPFTIGLTGADNSAAFTNTTLTGALAINGTDTVVTFHDATITNYPASGTVINNLNGTRNTLRFDGDSHGYMQWLDLGGTGEGNLLHFCEGVQFTNRFGTLRLNGGRSHTVRVDPGAAISPAINCSVPDCTVVFTNATLRGIFATTAERCRINFHDSCISNRPPTSYVISSFTGKDGCVSFTGSKAVFWMNYMDLGGVSNRMEFADGIIATNAPFAFRFSDYSRDCTIDIGAGAQLLISAFTFDYSGNRNTNDVVRLGKGAKVTCHSGGNVRGVGSRLVLDDAEYLSQGTSGGEVVGTGGSVELLGDEAKFTCSTARGAMGWLHLGDSIGADAPPLTMLFRPGATGYHGTPPVSLYSPYYSYIKPTVVFDVDATAFARGKPGGIYDIPLVRKGKLCTYSGITTDLDALNAIGVFVPASGRLAFDDDDNLVFRFKRDVGTRLLLR